MPIYYRDKRKVKDAIKITLPYLPDTVVNVEDMLKKVPKLRYLDHDAKQFPDMVEESYLANIGEIGPLGKQIMELAHWITWLYNFGCSKNVGLCVKQFLARVHGGILWMDRPVQLNVVLIAKIMGLPTMHSQLEEYLDSKAC